MFDLVMCSMTSTTVIHAGTGGTRKSTRIISGGSWKKKKGGSIVAFRTEEEKEDNKLFEDIRDETISNILLSQRKMAEIIEILAKRITLIEKWIERWIT